MMAPISRKNKPIAKNTIKNLALFILTLQETSGLFFIDVSPTIEKSSFIV